ncbi:MAG: histone H1-like repetitive region-containing protein [Acidimicrobiia bacterium]|nr:histone H1-like repetitive region-containing protein [Acidimicrobiia bacterium]
MTAKKSPAKKSKTAAAKKPAAVKKAAARKPPVKKAPVKRAAAKKSPVKKAAAKKAPAKKAPAKKAPAKKAPAKKPAAKRAATKAVAAAKGTAAKTPMAPTREAAHPPMAPLSRRGAGRLGGPGRRVTAAPPPEPPRKPQPIPFKKGDKVVYPHHGAATIIATEKREFDGKKQDFFVLQVAIDSLILRVPAARSLDLGVRPVISKTAAKRVLAVFRTEPEEAGANWSRWYKLLTEKINSGDIFQVAEVVRDLTFAQQTKGISPALKRMLSKARMILASELRFALNLSEEEAMKRLDKSLPRVDTTEEE